MFKDFRDVDRVRDKFIQALVNKLTSEIELVERGMKIIGRTTSVGQMKYPRGSISCRLDQVEERVNDFEGEVEKPLDLGFSRKNIHQAFLTHSCNPRYGEAMVGMFLS